MPSKFCHSQSNHQEKTVVIQLMKMNIPSKKIALMFVKNFTTMELA
jgi:hypothetical protein